ncbi:MAG: rRNA pseudouridine synthase [Fibrobacteraceae bacterium]|nr:rRNA pseudouridine synthase [Fibrobacteraceae bacterium]
MKMRINKYLSLCGVASRRASDEFIKEKRISVNGQILENPGMEVDENDEICVDGKPVYPPKRTKVLLFHKPPGCVCSVKDPQGRCTVYDYLPPGYHSLKYIGRLDLQSRGLLLFTDDGDLLYKLTHPKFEIPRSYLVWTTRQLTRSDATKITKGIDLGDGETGHAEAIYFEDGFVEMVLSEGKNREIRRMLEAVGYEIRDLKRITYAGITLGDLAAGDFRELTPAEEKKLREACKK